MSQDTSDFTIWTSVQSFKKGSYTCDALPPGEKAERDELLVPMF